MSLINARKWFSVFSLFEVFIISHFLIPVPNLSSLYINFCSLIWIIPLIEFWILNQLFFLIYTPLGHDAWCFRGYLMTAFYFSNFLRYLGCIHLREGRKLHFLLVFGWNEWYLAVWMCVEECWQPSEICLSRQLWGSWRKAESFLLLWVSICARIFLIWRKSVKLEEWRRTGCGKPPSPPILVIQLIYCLSETEPLQIGGPTILGRQLPQHFFQSRWKTTVI